MSDPNRYVRYYANQVGHNPYFSGQPVQYGRGLGSIFSRIFRFITPLIKTGVSIAKPHVKSAAKNIAGELASRAIKRMTSMNDPNPNQEGKGFAAPGTRLSYKRRKRVGTRSFAKRSRGKAKRKPRATRKRRGGGGGRRGFIF